MKFTPLSGPNAGIEQTRCDRRGHNRVKNFCASCGWSMRDAAALASKVHVMEEQLADRIYGTVSQTWKTVETPPSRKTLLRMIEDILKRPSL